jgi:CubicO group peptidase (beta-lactamase class C family)
MDAHGIPGAAIALISEGEIVDVQGFGALVAGGSDPVTPDTAFQVGSISKFVTAVGALRLAGEGRLDLDAEANAYLSSWRLPAGPGGVAVTVRQLLGHTAGLELVQNQSYQPGAAMPTLLDLLNGRPPATNPQVGVERVPGTEFRNANVNYAVLQQVLADATGRPFAELMRELVLDPLGMTGSSFDQDHPFGRPVALGHDSHGRPLPGGWRTRPDVAAAGLWSTAADLARLALEVRRAYLGQGRTLLSPAMAAQMLTSPGDQRYGLGSLADLSGGEVEYGHSGETDGYRALVFVRLHAGGGVVALTNAESGHEVIRFLASALDGRTSA